MIWSSGGGDLISVAAEKEVLVDEDRQNCLLQLVAYARVCRKSARTIVVVLKDLV